MSRILLPDHLVVLVNGLPAAGKSTLAPELAVALELPLFGKDLIKEAHADVLGAEPPEGAPGGQPVWNRRLGAAASETMWRLLAHAPRGAVLESSWRADVRHLVEAGLERAGATCVVEVWCEVPFELARWRDRDRIGNGSRHPIHGPLMPDVDWSGIEADAEPLALGPVLEVDTTGPVDLAALVTRIRQDAGTSA